MQADVLTTPASATYDVKPDSPMGGLVVVQGLKGVNARYTKELRERFGYSATWFPTLAVSPGDVGRMDGYQFERLCGLADLDVPFAVRVGKAKGTIKYASSEGVEVSVGGSASAATVPLVTAGASVSITFSREGAIWFQAEDCVPDAIEDLFALETAILARHAAGEWDDDLVVVTEVIRAARGTVIISGANQGGIDLHVDGPAAGAVAAAGMRIVRSRNIATQVVGHGDLTPLFRAKGIKRSLIRRPALETRLDGSSAAGRTTQQIPDVAFVEVDYESFA